MSDEIEMIEVKRGHFLSPADAERRGYNLWLLCGRPRKGEPFWGVNGLWPILEIALVSIIGWLITPPIAAAVHVMLSPIFDALR